MKDADQLFRLRRFWGATVFSLGIFWGFSSLVYFPMAALTSVKGSSWLEVAVVLMGGIGIFIASVSAFFNRRIASSLLLVLGPVLLAIATGGQFFSGQNVYGALNLLLLFLSGAVALGLGIFGWTTERKGWPTLRDRG